MSVQQSIDRFSHHQRMILLRYLAELDIKICEASDGSRVNLDALDGDVLESIKKKIHAIEASAVVPERYQI